MESEFPIAVAVLIGAAIYFAGSGFLSAIVANDKGRDVLGWFILGACFGPLALLALIGLSSRRQPSSVGPSKFQGAPQQSVPAAPRRNPHSRETSLEEFYKGPVGQFIKGGNTKKPEK